MRTSVDMQSIVMGVSAGGLQALSTIVPALPADFPVPIVIVQHLPSTSDDYLPRSLNEKCRIAVKQADDKETPEPGVVYIAPPNYHLLVELDGTFSLSIDERVNYSRPSIDVLFETAADVFGGRAVGVILTGASSDGSRGLRRIKESGGLTIVQDPESAQAEIMPRAALAETEVDWIVPLEEIGPILCQICMGSSAGSPCPRDCRQPHETVPSSRRGTP